MAKRSEYSFEELLFDVEGSELPTGSDISLSSIYDEIKKARFEEDSNVSFGIWERDLKKANWETVEELSIYALKSKSKDLQIVGWLIESLINLDGFLGILKGINFLTKFLEKFLTDSFPHNEDSTSDDEQKQKILDWIYELVAKKSNIIPFITDSDSISLYNYEYAVELKMNMLRAPSSSNELLNFIKQNNLKTLDEIKNNINAISDQIITDFNFLLQNIEEEIQKLVIVLKSKNFLSNPFTNFLKNIEKIKSILPNKKSANSVIEQNKPIFSVKNSPSKRDDVYAKLSDIAQELENIEKHSPSYCVLNLVVSWRDKNLLEIMNDLKNGNSEAHQLLKFLIN